jgi:hypothetical protein
MLLSRQSAAYTFAKGFVETTKGIFVKRIIGFSLSE